ncbi:mesoderm posterior protein 2-like [Megalops cyprinoides]|uniref:mesoderm posterior protein 2-like n=1 Tax=Megalops cyprinoides TaxID=118141 RepID=UPI001863B51D|nr:mesoderm posterior protein 2-like [Megalops cyprinoides]
MDISAPCLSYTAQYQWNSHSSDSEFTSMSSPEAVSPASPVGYGYIPPYQPCATLSGGKVRRNRSKNPSKQRQSASEKEKLRMRDLTKALHHLRTYLPPSVAPVGQTLTKIETLRLTIRYIAHLSAQLGLSEEALSRRAKADTSRQQNSLEIQGCFQYSSAPELWGQGQSHNQHMGQYESLWTPVCPKQSAGVEHNQFNAALELSAQDSVFNSSMDSFLQSPKYAETAHSCQMYSQDLPCQMVSAEFWI